MGVYVCTYAPKCLIQRSPFEKKLGGSSHPTSDGHVKGSTICIGCLQKFSETKPLTKSTAGMCLDAMSAENMKAYFDLMRDMYDNYDCENHPEAIYNGRNRRSVRTLASKSCR